MDHFVTLSRSPILHTLECHVLFKCLFSSSSPFSLFNVLVVSMSPFTEFDVTGYSGCCEMPLNYSLSKKIFSLKQWFLTFFAPLTTKSQNNFHGPLKCYYILLTDPLILVKEVKMGTLLYFSDLHEPPRALEPLHGPLRVPWTPPVKNHCSKA